jgi:endonuclease YncB( thermonuclease family)
MGLCATKEVEQEKPTQPPSPFDVISSCTLENTPAFTWKDKEVPVKVLRVVDGDTLDVALFQQEWNRCFKYRVRLYGIDTPEKKPSLLNPHRDAEIAAAHLATKAMTDYLETVNWNLFVLFHESDKYGRLLGTCYHPLTRENLNQWMIDQGHAVPYFGKTKANFIAP